MTSMRPPRWYSSQAPVPPMAATRTSSGAIVSNTRVRSVMDMTVSGLCSQPVALALAVERARVDAEGLRRLLHRRRRGEDASDVFGLHVVEGDAAAEFHTGARRRADLHRQVGQPYQRPGGED